MVCSLGWAAVGISGRVEAAVPGEFAVPDELVVPGVDDPEHPAKIQLTQMMHPANPKFLNSFFIERMLDNTSADFNPKVWVRFICVHLNMKGVIDLMTPLHGVKFPG